jgi:hypothetical protein
MSVTHGDSSGIVGSGLDRKDDRQYVATIFLELEYKNVISSQYTQRRLSTNIVEAYVIP